MKLFRFFYCTSPMLAAPHTKRPVFHYLRRTILYPKKDKYIHLCIYDMHINKYVYLCIYMYVYILGSEKKTEEEESEILFRLPARSDRSRKGHFTKYKRSVLQTWYMLHTVCSGDGENDCAQNRCCPHEHHMI